ncbi:MAG: thiamine pyrophosphate-binding protein [Xanthobacteraceae bacterium]
MACCIKLEITPPSISNHSRHRNVATGKLAVASVTCGPGVTQVMTALPAAVRARLPMVVFVGESPINAKPADSMPFDIAPGVLDPRKVIRAIDAVVPKDCEGAQAEEFG